MRGSEVFIGELEKEACFAYARVSDEDELDEVVECLIFASL